MLSLSLSNACISSIRKRFVGNESGTGWGVGGKLGVVPVVEGLVVVIEWVVVVEIGRGGVGVGHRRLFAMAAHPRPVQQVDTALILGIDARRP